MVDISDEKIKESQWYTYYQIGLFNLKLGNYEDAILFLNQSSQEQVLTLKAIADAHRQMSTQDFKLGHQANAKLHLDQARGKLDCFVVLDYFSCSREGLQSSCYE